VATSFCISAPFEAGFTTAIQLYRRSVKSR
jgi:hypothetical protein